MERTGVKAALTPLLMVLVLAACGTGASPAPQGDGGGSPDTTDLADEYPDRPITIIVPFDAGGSVDRLARGLASFLTYELAVPITVENRGGAGGQAGHSYFLEQPDDGYTLLVTPATPYIANNILLTDAAFEMDDFAFVNAQWIDWTMVAVPADRPWQSIEELIEHIKTNPGEVSVGVTFGSAGHLSTLVLLETLEIPIEDLNIVTFDGGGPLRTALAGGQIDFSIVQAEGSETVAELIRPLAVFLEERDEVWDAPPINEALAPYGVEIPIISGSVRTLATSAAFREAHPERWETLVDAYQRTLERPDYQEWLDANEMAGQWLGPEETERMVDENYEILQQYSDLLSE